MARLESLRRGLEWPPVKISLHCNGNPRILKVLEPKRVAGMEWSQLKTEAVHATDGRAGEVGLCEPFVA